VYKATARSLRNRTRVHVVDVQPVAYHTEDDFILTADNMSERDCLSERQKLILEKTRLENELQGAKNIGDKAIVSAIGHKLQALGGRLSLINKRLHQLRQVDSHQAFWDAAKEIVDTATMERVHRRKDELLAARATPTQEQTDV
jgi:hypothetical protein